MSFLDVLQECQRSGIKLAVKDGKLLADDAEGALTAGLRERLRAHKGEILEWLAAGRTRAAITPQPGRTEYPLSFSQQRLWLVDQLEGGSAEYNMPAAFGLSGVLDLGVLQRSLDTIVERHAVLRTVFRLHEGEPVQVVLPLEPVAIHHSDFEALDSQAQQAVVQRMIREEARRPFDLANDRMLRCSLLRLRADYHVVLFTMHHIASDGWSMGVLIREFVALYEAGIAGREAQLPELRVQYGDFAAWQRESMQGDLLAAELAYWQQRLAGMPVLHSLPLDKPRPAQQSFGAERIHQLIDKPLLDATHRLARRQQATLFMALQSAFAVLLSRFSGESDIVMGVPNGGRAQQELAPLIGFFINSQVLRTQIDPQQTVAELLTQARHHALDAFARNNIPFDLLVDTLKHPRSLAYNPLCQVKFVVQNHEVGELELPGLKLEPVGKGEDRVHFDLDLTITETAEGLQLSWSYKAELFQRASIERMAEAYRCLLQAMVAQPDARLIELSVLEERDLAALRAQGEGPVNAIGREQLLPQRIDEQAARTPEAVAVRCGEQWLSYAALNAKANRLAHLLMEQGVGRGSRVGVHLGRSVELLLAQLAVMKTGAAYVLLDPKQNSERLGLMARDAGLEVVLLDSRHTTLPVLGLDMVYVDEAVGATEWLSEYSEHAPEVVLSAEDSVYVLYTSGSTGEPKGVEVHHGGVIDYCAFAQSGYYSDSLSGSLVATSAAFDLTLPALYVPLLAGGCVTLLPEHDELEALTAWLAQRHEAVLLRLTPSHVQALLLLSDEWPRPAAHVFVIGGEVFEPALARRLQAKFPASQIYNHYGPTETVVGCAWYDVSGNLETLGERIALGRAMENTALYVLDESGRLQAPGVAGELYIGGAGVAKGYVNRPEQTAAQFVTNPFGAGRLYRSGDRVRWRADGNLEFLGRIDRQVKLRGFRIELGEIESRLRQCTGVREAVVRLWGEAESAQLVAYLVAAESLADANAESPEEARLTRIRSQLTSQLPDYMQPSGYVWLDRLPLTVNGKVDVQALPAPDGATLLQREYEAPQGEIEQTLAGLWQTLLGVERVGRHDHFFELGGHSLLAVQLMSHIRATLNVEVPLRALFAQPTLQALAETVAAAGASTLGQIVPADRSQPLPLSLAQQRLWFLDQLDPAASASYHLPTALRLSGTLNRQALHATLDRLVARHEGLRTRFVAVEGVPYQVIAPQDIGFALVEHDLGGLDADTRAQRVAQWVAEEARAPFDLAKGPLIRGQLLRLSDEEHVLLVTQHHVITDGWSIGVMVREVAALYTAFCQGQPDPLPALEIQYADYAAWQRSWLQGEELERQIDFWRTHLRDAPALLELPTDRPRSAVQRFAGGTVSLTLPATLTAGLRTLSQRHGTTLFMTLLAGWSTLLSRLSGQSDVVIGTPVANRQRREVEDLIGFFVNTLALRVRLEDQPNVAQLLQQVKETTLAAFSHQELPFEQVVEVVQPVRSLSHSPIAQVTFTWHNQPDGGELLLPDLTLAPVERSHTTTQADLSLHLVDAGEVFSGALVYASDLFDASTIERWAGHFVTLLEAMVADDARRIGMLPLLSSREREHLLRDFNDTAAAYPDAALVHELFEAQVAAEPDAVAVVYEDERLTYGELNARANQLAHYLIGQGVKPDDRVAICVERSLDMVVGLLGILKSGAGYVPLDPAYPAERLAYALSDSGPVVVLTQEACVERLPALTVPVLIIDSAPVQDMLAAQSVDNPRVAGLASHHLAYVIYTSGSTGMPKGVMIEHRNIARLFAATEAWFQFDRQDVWTLFHSFAFDFSVWELWGALLYGGRVVAVPYAISRSPEDFYGLLCREEVTVLNQTPSAFRQLIAAQSALGNPGHALRQVIFGGEALEVAALRPWYQQACNQHTQLINMYGITETTVHVTYRTLEARDCERVGSSPIGHPIPDLRVYILDAHGQPVPLGVTGEMYVAGAGVARGYLNQPGLTAERFLADPFCAEVDARMYKTGDLGRWLPDGTIEYLGRNDFQVKIRGFRIELGEIEAKLSACEGVREAVVIAREDVPGDKRLVAYVVADDGVELSAASLRDGLSLQLPEYMVPAAFLQLAALPLTANGKLDRRALPAPDASSLVQREYEAPQGEIEQTLARLWQTLLGVEQVGRHDHFFELGGHSLLAVQLMSHIRAALDVEVPLRALFAQPTLQALAEAVAQAGASTLGRIEPADRSQPLPLSLAQQRLWFLDQLDPAASGAYHISAALRLCGVLNREALHATLDRLVARHEGLRTRFVAVDGVPYQVIAPDDAGFVLTHQDLGDIGEQARASKVAEVAREEARAPFDMAQGPLIRGQLLRLSDDEHVLLLTQHHIISDGWSTGVMVREVGALYTAFCQGQPDPLPALTIQYADYAAWQRGWLQGEELERQVDFWRDHLRDAPALLELPTDRPRPPVQSHAGGTVSLTLPATLTAGLRTLSQRHGVTLFMTLLAGWSALLSRLSGQSDVVIGTPVANRQRREVEDLIGFFVNTLAVRVRLDDKPSVAQLLQQVKETTLSAFGHQELPFEQVVEAVQPIRSLSHSPIAQVTFTWHNQPDGGELVLPGLTLAPVERSHTTTQADLSLHLTDAGEVFAGALVYATALFDQATIERMAGHFVNLLEGMVKAEQAGIHTVQLLGAEERERVLQTFNATAVAYPQDALIHEQFQAQAAAQPEAVAVVCGDESLSYGELEARANQLAHYLMGQGVKPDDRVAIAVERGIDLIVGLLGILKAGGAYVPLDPSYPAERLAWMLEDSDSRFLLTQTEVEAHLPALSVPVLRLDVDFPVLARRLPTHAPDIRAQSLTARHLAYVIYTSGSTGLPKGVMVEHRCVNRLVLNNPYFAATPSDCFAHCANPAFDAATWEIWGALLNGARLWVVPQAQVLDPAQLNASLVSGGVTALWLTVGLFNQYVDALGEAFGHLRYLLVGGDALDPRSIRRLLAREQRPVHVVNGYGPTETTTFACTHDIGEVAEDARSIPLGRPIANTRVYILDAQGEPVPIGAVGELYIGGHGVARGYLNRPELTAERFVADRFTTEADARMYKTGDLGRWRSDGTIEYLGRNDFQVKIRGFRIELGEIEAKLAACEGVREAVVIAREDVPGDKRLVAYVVPEEGVELSAASLRDGLSVQLPEYMVPGAFLQLEALPLTANGKLDRRALPAPDASALVQREYEAPQGEIEQTLARLWQDLLGVEQVGRHDQFFELGGHSLLVVALVERLRGEGLKGEVRAIFATPTLREYAATLVRADATESAVPANGITPQTTQITPELLPLIALTPADIERIVATVPGGVGNIQDIYPLLPLQEGLLFHHLLETHGDTYLLREAMAFDSRSRLDTFLRVLEQVIGRHDIFRTAVVWEGLPRPVQVVYRQASLPVHELVLAGADSALEELLERTDPKHLRLDLRTAPMFAAYIAKDAANGEWLLSLLYHHLVCDHMTLALVMGEMRALLSGAGESLAPAASLRSIVAQAGTTPEADHEAYFRQELGDIDEPTAPFGVLNVQVGGSELETAHRRLDGALAQRIRDCARGLGVSPAVLFHVAWAQVLARCTGRDDVVFGTVLSGRLQGASGADRAVGMFINTLPIRIAIGERGVRQVVQESYQRMVALLAHEQASLAMAQRCSGVPAQLPLFTALLNYRHSEDASVSRDASGLEGIRKLLVREAANYPMSISVDDYGQGFALKTQCAHGIDADRINGYLQTAVQGLIASLDQNPESELRQIEILPASERDQLLQAFNDTDFDYPSDKLIHELFEAQAAVQPDAVAVICEDQSLTYAELNARANQLAHYLIAQGVQPDDRVAVCAERSVDLIVSMLGILKSGAAYAPLDPGHPAERLAHMLEDCAPKAVLTQMVLADRLPDLAVPTLALDAIPTQAMLAAQTTHNPQPRAQGATSRHLAYVIYTSGSTGEPKGVLLEHRSVVRLIINRYIQVTPEDCVVQCANPAFDAATWEIWTGLLQGARLLVIPQRVLLDAAAFGAALRTHGVTVLHLTVGLFNQYAQALAGVFPQLNYLLFGGEKADAGRVMQVLRHSPPRHLVQCYGPTETTTFASTHEISSLVEGAHSVSIGRPIANTKIYLLDSHGRPVPLGTPGEITIGGDGVGRGYLNRPELTAERFLRDPFSAQADARMYKTGDLGRWLADGTIEYLGRNDFQIKIRGFRIELGEIEAKLSACEGVREAVVVAHDVPGDKRLVAYLVAQDGIELSAASLRDALSAQLPDYMVPGAFMQLEALPLTANGKLDRRALPMPDAWALVQREYEEPQGEIEQTLARVWQELLGVEQVGRNDHFFELGGHSLIVVALVERLRAAGLKAEVRAIFATPTLSDYAALLVRDSADAEESPVPPNGIAPDATVITPDMLPLVALSETEIDTVVAAVPGGVGNVQDIYPLLPLQEGMLFHYMLEEKGDTYLSRSVFAFDSRERLDHFLRVLEQVIARHDILRTAVLWENLPQPVQVVHRQVSLPVHELAVPNGRNVVEDVLERTDPKRLRLDLRQAPLMAAYVAEDRENGEWVLSLLNHHIVCDHVTLDLFMVEVRMLLAGKGQSLVAAQPFRDVVAQAGKTPEAEHEAYFRQEFGDIDEPTAPFGVLNVRVDSGELETARLRVDDALASRIRNAARREGLSAAVLFHVAWAQVVARCTGRDDVVFGTVLSGRLQGTHGADRAAGMFLNTLPIRISVGERGARQVVQESYQRMVALLAHEQAPLVLAQRCSGVSAPMPLFTSLLNYRRDGDASGEPPVATDGIRRITAKDAASYPIAASIIDYGRHFELSTQCIHEIGAERINGYLLTAMAGLVDALEQKADVALRSIEVLPAAEREQLLSGTDGAPRYSRDVLIHELFEQQAAEQPDAVAVVYEDERLTYGELNARANQLAHYLIGQGVKADDRVAICVERSLDMVVGLLGILKAGAGYVPLDPAYPAERLAYALSDSGPVVVLTQEACVERLPALTVPVLIIDSAPVQAMLAAQSVDNPRAAGLASHHLAYVIYTSGSTGMPKGVMIEHRNVARLFAATEAWFQFDRQDVWTLFHSFAFDFSVWELWGALLYGGRVVVVPYAISRSPEDFYGLLCREEVTVLNQTPSAFRQLIAAQSGLGNPGHALRQVIFGGEALEVAALRPWYQQACNQHTQLVNMYGITETTVHVTYRSLEARDCERVGSSPIGHPIPDLRVYILDTHGQPVPVGVTGEMYVAGAGVARGYLNQPGLTAERFVADPFCAEVDARMYKTGDLGRWLPDGTIEYQGRNDFQVKIRGFRIELGEIEAKLSACEGVREAVVIAREDVPGDKRLVAYVVADDGVEPSAAALRSAVAAQLPDYMVPSAFVVIDALPLTINGKLDRKALPAPDGAALVSHVYVAPENEAEQRLTEIWQQLLRVPALGVEDNFFALGGDSILAIQVVTRANMAGIAITTRQLFEAQTIRALARLAGSAPQVLPPQGEVEGELTLLPIQQMFLHDDDADRHHFNQSLLLRTPEGCNAEMLRAMVSALFRRHDALRLGFVENEGQWQALHRPWDEAQLEESCIVEALPERVEDRAAFISTRCQHWQEAFDLARGPLLRAVYFADGAGGEGRLLLSVHHLVVDGVSWRVLLTDLEQAYDQCLRGEAVRLAAKTSSLQQWGAALTRHAHSAPMQGEKGLWLTQSRSRLSPLPVDHEHGGSVLADTKTAAIRLSAEETRALLQQCHGAYRTQINELLLSGVYLGLRAWTGEAAFRLRMEGHGREALFDDLDINQTVGWFTSVYPLLLHSQSADVGAVIKSVKEQYRAIPNHGIGYGLLRYLSGDDELAKAESGNAAELEFNYLGQFDQVINAETRFQAAPESGGSNASGQRRRACRLSLNGMVFGGELQLTLSYSGREYEPATIERVLGLLTEGLRQVIAHCQAPGVGGYTPSDFPLAQLDQTALEDLQDRYPSLSRLYPATPMQAGLHFHSLLDRSAYMVQKFLVLRGTLGVDAFRKAWQQLLARHDILRTAFVGSNEAMHQVVVNALDVCWHEADWRDLDAATQAARFEAYRQQDKQSGFAFEQPGLMRIALFRLGEDRYQLLWTLHHILVDGWCFPLLYRDVMRLYYAALAGERAQLNDPPPYETYIDWLHRQGIDEARAYWRAQLSDIEAPTPLVIDRLPGDGGEGHYEPMLSLTLEETQALRTLAKARHITINTLLQWSWAYLLHRYSGESDVVFGNVISGRPAELPGVDQMVGLFINIIPVRMTFDDGRGLAESLTALHENFQRASDYGYLSLLDIQQQSGVPGGRALFDSMLVFGNYPMDALHDSSGVSSEVPQLQIEYTENEDLAHYRLGLRAALRERLEIGFAHKRKDFSEASIARLMAHYGRVLRQLPAAVEQGEAAVSLLADDERQQLLYGFNDTAVAYPQDALIHEQFQAQAAAQPDAVALVCEDQQLTYGELEARANQLAHYLLGQGVKPDDRVAICMERGLDMVVGLLGILKAGAGYVPLDPAYPVERLTYMLEDCAPALLLTQSDIEEQLHDLELPVLRLDVDFPVLARRLPTHAPDIRAQGLTARHLAYVIYTSGSTGTPKGVMVDHRCVNRLVLNNPYFAATRSDCFAHCANPAFDAATWEIWGALLNGARLWVVPQAQVLDPVQLNASLMSGGVTALWLTVGLFNQYVDALGEAFGQLRYLLVGGDALDPRSIRRLLARERRPVHVVNGYGPTETTTFACTHDIGEVAEDARSIPLGRPIANTRVYILDAQGEPVPIGAVGELYIGGHGVARGYLNRPELTAERFVEDPFAAESDARMYKTGDLGRWRSDGTIEYLGRNDFQVKIRGFRIELGEIEAKLSACEGVREAVVLAREDVPGDKRLVAYVVSEEGVELSAAALRDGLSLQLPEYMVPGAFLQLEALPLTANGKLDRRALPAPDASALASRVYEAPQGEVEKALAEIWQELLGIPQVGRHDHFFDLGGHSLLAVTMSTRLKERFHVALPLKTLFSHPQIMSLGEQIAIAQLALFSSEEIADMQAELGEMSDEELQAFLEGNAVD